MASKVNQAQSVIDSACANHCHSLLHKLCEDQVDCMHDLAFRDSSCLLVLDVDWVCFGGFAHLLFLSQIAGASPYSTVQAQMLWLHPQCAGAKYCFDPPACVLRSKVTLTPT